MNTPPPRGDGEAAGASPMDASAGGGASRRQRPVIWMVIAGVAILAAIGLGLWAMQMNSDLDASESALEEQTAATQAAEAQVAAQTEAATAAAAEVEKITAANEVYVVSNEDVAQAQSEVAAAEEAVAQANAAAAEVSDAAAAAQDEATRLRAELEQARAERDLARAERRQARLCSRGALGAISLLGAADEQAAEQVETASSACAPESE